MTHSFPSRRSSDLGHMRVSSGCPALLCYFAQHSIHLWGRCSWHGFHEVCHLSRAGRSLPLFCLVWVSRFALAWSYGHCGGGGVRRSEEHTSELQSLMRISYAVFCLKKKKK